MKSYCFTEQRKSQINANKYKMNWWIHQTEVGTQTWGKFFYWPRMLAELLDWQKLVMC